MTRWKTLRVKNIKRAALFFTNEIYSLDFFPHLLFQIIPFMIVIH